MKLVVDENIPGADQLFAQFGAVQRLPGRAINAAVVRDADILVVRSVTRIDAALLRGSRVRFVGSTTAGIDHVCLADLDALGIRFAHAPGSNADSVVDYVLGVLALRFPDAASIASRRIGIVGCGNVGGRLLRRLRALGISCRVYDPFVEGIAEACAFDEVLDCDVLSLHVPLTSEGDHPTRYLLGAAQLQALATRGLLINTARGAVVDNAALLGLLRARADLGVVLDVWEHEPRIEPALLARTLIGTPHIAGYAVDGKLRGVAQVYRALCDFLQGGAPLESFAALQLPPAGVVPAQATGWQQAVLGSYDPRTDDAQLRALAVATPADIATGFDRLRRDYPARRELGAWHIGSARESERAQLLAAGFHG